MVTGSHICVTLVLTVTQSLLITKNVVDLTRFERINTAFCFFNGVGDLFLSLILWFILDVERLPAFIVDGDKVYSVRDVIRVDDSDSDSALNMDCDEEEEETGTR